MKTSSRRALLRALLISTASATLSPIDLLALDARPGNLPPMLRKKRIAVIGAGIAGLTAAIELSNAGHDVVVIEASDHAGGRVRTLRKPFSDNLFAEAGAARIPEFHELTLDYVKHYGLELAPFQPDDLPSTVRFNNRNYTSNDQNLFTALDCSEQELKLGPVGALLERTSSAKQVINNLEDSSWPTEEALRFDRINSAEMFRQLGVSEGLVRFLDLGFGVLGELSGLDILLQLDSLLSNKFRIVGGNDRLPVAMANQIRDLIQYNMPVHSIIQKPDSVLIHCNNGLNSQTFEADRVIVTVPLTVLRQIQITPGLSPTKKQAIDNVQYAAVSRVFVQLKEKFWKAQGVSGFAASDHPIEIFDASFGQESNKGLLMAYLHEDIARQFDANDADTAFSTIVGMMNEIFPGLTEHIEKTSAFSWQKDPWAQGAIALWKPGDFENIYPHLPNPEGRLHFAGEHCSPWHSWIQGAIHSGQKVAFEVNDA